jgi:hypothetical protein
VAEKAEGETGWLFPVGDEAHEFGYVDMFNDMLNALDKGVEPAETFYDGYVVNAIIDACYRSSRSKKWEPVTLDEWRSATTALQDGSEVGDAAPVVVDERFVLIKEEKMPDGKTKLILKDKESGKIVQRIS